MEITELWDGAPAAANRELAGSRPDYDNRDWMVGDVGVVPLGPAA
jgi:hypothetical protein